MTSVTHPAITASASPPPSGRGLSAPWRAAARWALIDVGCWSAVTLIFAGQQWVVSGWGGVHQSFVALLVEEVAMWAPCAVLAPLVVLLTLRARGGAGDGRQAIAMHVVGALLFAVLGGLTMGALDWVLSHQDVHAGFRTVVGHDIVEQLTSFLLIYGLIVAAVQAVAYGRESRERQLAAVRLQRELAEARLNAVTTQLQPHFLFNTLNAVSVLVRSDPARAERTIGRLSDLLRYALTSVDDTRTTVHEEVRFLQKYVEIQQARFGDRLRVSIAVDARAEGAVVPRLLLQPLVENAIRHGISPRAAPGHVEIRVSREGARVRVVVSDDGVGLSAVAVREGVGLTATRARLRQEYDADYEFTLGSRGTGGTVAMVAVPYRDS
jgi:two-component system, LytTR family, sensor kinase